MKFIFNIAFLFYLCNLYISCNFLSDPNSTRVLLIGIDGLTSQCINYADHEIFEYLVQNGSYSFKARTAIQSLSAPGWSNILCGMPTEDTGITTNSWIAQKFFKRVNRISSITDGEYLPCIFQEIKKNNKKLKNFAVYNWEFFLNFGNSITPDVLDEEVFKYTLVDYMDFSSSDKYEIELSLKLFQKDFNFFFLYLGALDMAGHSYGWCGKEYIQRLNIINKQIEILFNKLKEIGKFHDTYIILATDHGGAYQKNWHGVKQDDNIMVPLFIIGPGIKKNHEIKTYTKLLDISPTVMKILGYEPNPIWRGRVIKEIFENSK
jgi:hypothetical protein